MPAGSLFRDDIEVLRSTPTGETNDWNQDIYGAPEVAASGKAEIQPLTLEEVGSLADAGAEIGDFRMFTLLTGIRGSDQVRRAGTDEVYEVRAVLDFGPHREVLLRRLIVEEA